MNRIIFFFTAIYATLRKAQFGLTTLFAVVTVVSIFLGVRTSRERAYRARVSALALLLANGTSAHEIKLDAKNPESPDGSVPLDPGKETIEPDDAVVAIEIRGFDNEALLDRQVSALLAFPTLRVLVIHDRKITVEQLQQIGKIRSLEAIDLGFLNVTDEGLRQLGGLRSLRQLRLYGTDVTDAGLEFLAPLATLENLDLGSTRITSAGLSRLAALRSLRGIGLSATRIGDDGVPHLNALSSLQRLDIGETKISDAGLALLCLPRLECLLLDGDAIGDIGLVHLGCMRQLCHLSLEATRITDDGLKMLRRFDSLDRVNLRQCRVSDAGLPSLGKIPTLHEAFLEGAKLVTPEGFARLTSARPGLIAFWELDY